MTRIIKPSNATTSFHPPAPRWSHVPRVAVLGASGHTGRRVVEALLRRGADVTPLARRTGGPDARDRDAVRRAIADADALVNLAGPFLRTGLAPMEAALDAGVPYVDTTGEQAFMALARERLDARARAAGIPMVNALAFEYALGDLATKLHLPHGGDALHVLYWPRATRASAGTKKSMLRVLAAPALTYENGHLRRTAFGRYQRSFQTPHGERLGLSFAGGEVLTIPRHTPFRTVRTYFRTSPRRAPWLRRAAPLARALLRGPALTLTDALVDARHEPPTNERASGEIHLVTEPHHEHVIIRTPDAYEITAEIAAEGALHLISHRNGGVLAPAEALDPRTILHALTNTMPGFTITPPPDPPLA